MARLLLALFLILFITAAARADSLTYRNARFGTTITFPAELFNFRDAPPANGDGMVWAGPGHIALAVYGSYNAFEQSPKAYLSWSLENRSASEEVTYSRSGRDWAVISGRNNGTVFYERYVFGGEDVIHAMRLSYPASRKAEIDPFVGPIANSLSGP